MTEPPRSRWQFGLRQLFLLPLAVGLLIVLYSAGLPAELLFLLVGCPILIACWLALSRFVARFLSEYID